MNLYAAGRYADARKAYRQILEQHYEGDGQGITGAWAVEVAAATGDPAEAIALAKIALGYLEGEAPDRGRLYHLLGRNYQAVKRFRAATHAYQQGLRSPGTADATCFRLATDLVRLTTHAWSKQRAAEVLTEAVAARPSLLTSEAIVFRVARLNQEAGNIAEYKEYSRLLREKFPGGMYAQLLSRDDSAAGRSGAAQAGTGTTADEK